MVEVKIGGIIYAKKEAFTKYLALNSQATWKQTTWEECQTLRNEVKKKVKDA